MHVVFCSLTSLYCYCSSFCVSCLLLGREGNTDNHRIVVVIVCPAPSHNTATHTLSHFLSAPAGCIAEVLFAIKLARIGSVGSTIVVEVCGTSDSRLIRGIVAVLCRGLSGVSPNDILELDGDNIAESFGMHIGLSKSRIMGVSAMVAHIQSQISMRLEEQQESCCCQNHQQSESNVASIVTSSLPVIPLSPSASHELNREKECCFNGGDHESHHIIAGGDLSSCWPNAGNEVAVLISGGVDSSVALRILKSRGYSLRAFYLKIWLEDELSHLNECPWESDITYARAVCEQSGVPLEILSFQKEYEKEVIRYTLREAKAGRTPNPDVMCNSRVKFGAFMKSVGRHFKAVATGHYAQLKRVGVDGVTTLLQKSADVVKDQTYFLAALDQNQLSKAMFPIGRFTKSQVRSLADEFGLPNKARKDSQGICFLGKLRFEDFLSHHLGENPGLVMDVLSGEVVGRHRGLWFHTIGQRRGTALVINSKLTHLGPWYVESKDVERNILFVTNNRILPSDGGCAGTIMRQQRQFLVSDFNWIESCDQEVPFQGLNRNRSVHYLEVKIRHGPNIHDCKLTLGTSNRDKGMCELINNNGPNYIGFAAGQFAVFYKDQFCIGCGVIQG